MRKLQAFLAVALCVLAVNVRAGKAPSGRSAPIQKVFSEYREALLASDGEKAAVLMSARTIAFYDQLLVHALSTPREELSGLDFMSRFMILRIRHEYDKARLSEMTGRELFVTGVRRGWISRSTVANIEQLVSVKVDGNRAHASLPVEPTIPALFFLNESGEWKLDLLGSFEIGNDVLVKEVAKTGLSEEQFILRALDSLSPRKVDERILAGPVD